MPKTVPNLPPEMLVEVGKFLAPMSRDLLNLMKTCSKAYELLIPRFVESFDSNVFIATDLSRHNEEHEKKARQWEQFLSGPSGTEKFNHVKYLRASFEFAFRHSDGPDAFLVNNTPNLVSLDLSATPPANEFWVRQSHFPRRDKITTLRLLTYAEDPMPSDSPETEIAPLPALKTLVTNLTDPTQCKLLTAITNAAPNLESIDWTINLHDWDAFTFHQLKPFVDLLPNRFLTRVTKLRIKDGLGSSPPLFISALGSRKSQQANDQPPHLLLQPTLIHLAGISGTYRDIWRALSSDFLVSNTLSKLSVDMLPSSLLGDEEVIIDQIGRISVGQLALSAGLRKNLARVHWNLESVPFLSVKKILRKPSYVRNNTDKLMQWDFELEYWKHRLGSSWEKVQVGEDPTWEEEETDDWEHGGDDDVTFEDFEDADEVAGDEEDAVAW